MTCQLASTIAPGEYLKRKLTAADLVGALDMLQFVGNLQTAA